MALEPNDPRLLALQSAKTGGVELILLLTITHGDDTWRITDNPGGYTVGDVEYLEEPTMADISVQRPTGESHQITMNLPFVEPSDNAVWYNRLRGKIVGARLQASMVFRAPDGSLTAPWPALRFSGRRPVREIPGGDSDSPPVTITEWSTGQPKRTQSNTRYTTKASQELIDPTDTIYDRVADQVDETVGRP